MEDLLELSSDAMLYVDIEERSLKPLGNKWEDAKRTKLVYPTPNINPEFWINIMQQCILNLFNLISLLM